AKIESFKNFARDYPKNRNEWYIPAELPALPFDDDSFDLSLSGNFLFLYSDYSEGGMLIDSPFDYQFHLNAINEFMRVSKEVRIYPIKGPHRPQPHAFLAPLTAELQTRGFLAEQMPVLYRDVIDAHHMLRVSRRA